MPNNNINTWIIFLKKFTRNLKNNARIYDWDTIKSISSINKDFFKKQ